jgi:hypothetical protein
MRQDSDKIMHLEVRGVAGGKAYGEYHFLYITLPVLNWRDLIKQVPLSSLLCSQYLFQIFSLNRSVAASSPICPYEDDLHRGITTLLSSGTNYRFGDTHAALAANISTRRARVNSAKEIERGCEASDYPQCPRHTVHEVQHHDGDYR